MTNHFFLAETYDPEFTKTKMLPLWIHLIESESIEQVKMAIRCVGVHLTSTRNEVLAQVLHVSIVKEFILIERSVC